MQSVRYHVTIEGVSRTIAISEYVDKIVQLLPGNFRQVMEDSVNFHYETDKMGFLKGFEKRLAYIVKKHDVTQAEAVKNSIIWTTAYRKAMADIEGRINHEGD